MSGNVQQYEGFEAFMAAVDEVFKKKVPAAAPENGRVSISAEVRGLANRNTSIHSEVWPVESAANRVRQILEAYHDGSPQVILDAGSVSWWFSWYYKFNNPHGTIHEREK